MLFCRNAMRLQLYLRSSTPAAYKKGSTTNYNCSATMDTITKHKPRFSFHGDNSYIVRIENTGASLRRSALSKMREAMLFPAPPIDAPP